MKFSVVILALFAVCDSDAFAPSPSASMTSRTQLQAGSDLMSLLGEYSGVAPTPVEKAAEAVVSAPAVDNVAAINNAATAAQSAADQAAAAAAAVATSSVPAIKAAATGAAATAAASGSSIKPIIGGVFVKVDSAKINPDMQFDASTRAQENLSTLKTNFDAAIGGLSERLSSIDIPKVEGGVEGGSVDFSSFSAVDLQTIVDSLHLKEYGGWYAAIAMTLIASQQKTSGKEEAAAEFESELTLAQQKASEAAAAAGMAAEGAKTAKELAMKMDKDSKKGSGQAMLDSSKMKQVLLEKETMEQKLRELQSEVTKLNSQLEQAAELKKKAVNAVSSKKTEIEEEFPNKVTLEGDPDEDARIIELLKIMDEENKVKKREDEASNVKSQKNVDKKMTKGVEVAQAKAKVDATKKRAVKKKSKTKAKSKTSAKKKVETEKPTSAPAKAASSGNDWAQLAESTLKRKTVAQLTEYLTEKGVSVEKSMKKADLLNAVKKL